MKKNFHIQKKEKGKEKKQEGGKAKEGSSVKVEEVNAITEDFQDGDVLLTSSLDAAYMVAIDDLVMHDQILDSRT